MIGLPASRAFIGLAGRFFYREALGYSNTSKAIQQHVDDEDKGTLPIREAAYEIRAVDINESGLYALILSSKHGTGMGESERAEFSAGRISRQERRASSLLSAH